VFYFFFFLESKEFQARKRADNMDYCTLKYQKRKRKKKKKMKRKQTDKYTFKNNKKTNLQTKHNNQQKKRGGERLIVERCNPFYSNSSHSEAVDLLLLLEVAFFTGAVGPGGEGSLMVKSSKPNRSNSPGLLLLALGAGAG